MKLKKVASVVFCCALFGASDASSMPFRIGFEGQMEGHLCMQALSRPAIQKKPIFEIRQLGKKLWHVEFDGPDLEFVTVPFSCDERELLRLCMITMQLAVNDLMSAVREDSVSTVDAWFKGIHVGAGGEKVVSDPIFFQTQNLGAIQIRKASVDWAPVWRPQVTIQHPLRCAVDLYSSLFAESKCLGQLRKTIPEEIAHNTALGGLIFLQAHEMCGIAGSVALGEKDVKSNMILATALTVYFIEHNVSMEEISLEKIQEVIGAPEIVEMASKYYSEVLELYQNAYLFKINPLLSKKLSEHDPTFSKILGSFDDPRNARVADVICEARERDTVVQNVLFMMHTWQGLKTVNQFDAKRFTLLMSRRPMNHMFAEITAAAKESSFLTDEFSRRTLVDRNFSDVFCSAIPSCLNALKEEWSKSNFGEQFYDIGNNPMDLADLAEFCPIPFREYARRLLQQGVISTAMLRVMDLESLEKARMITPIAARMVNLIKDPEYLHRALESVQVPERKSFLKVSKADKVLLDAEPILLAVDLMSPPFPLDVHDSMGAYRNGLFSMETAQFGGAIVELRNVSDVKRFRKDQSIGFLTIPANALEELEKLFDFLKGVKIDATK